MRKSFQLQTIQEGRLSRVFYDENMTNHFFYFEAVTLPYNGVNIN